MAVVEREIHEQLTPPLATADFCDRYPSANVVQARFESYGGVRRCAGLVQTIQTDDDNSAVRAEVGQPGEGRVLVIDNAGGSTHCAMLGGNLAAQAFSNGWSGIVVNGAVRDLDELCEIPLAIFALTSCPMRSAGRGTGRSGPDLRIGGITLRPGDCLVADADGIAVLPAWAAEDFGT